MEATTKSKSKAKANGKTATAKKPASPLSRRLEELRAQAETDAAGAQRETWEWFQDAGERIASEREDAIAELDELFSAGKPSEGIDGTTEGILVGFTMHSVPDRIIGAITGGWMPWAGKRFDAENQRGDNILAKSAKWPARILWPFYGTKDEDDHLIAFDFTTRVEEGAVDPGLNVLVIDYAPVEDNPRVIIKSIRDELVEVIPGTHLGKMLWRSGPYEDAKHRNLAFFALKTPVA